jgi:hypothetical protein
MIFQQGNGTERDTQLRKILAAFAVASERADSRGRSLVLQGPAARYRLLLRHPSSAEATGYVVDPDEWLPARIAAIMAFHHPIAASGAYWKRWSFAPSPYQRYRLELLLRILDYKSKCVPRAVTLREIAGHVVFPHAKLGRATEWKTSSERRHTQRLVTEAQYLTKSGYRRLLKGRPIRAAPYLKIAESPMLTEPR